MGYVISIGYFDNSVVPVSAHAAFDKAAHYFKIKLIYAPVDEKTRKVDVKALRKLVNSNTVMVQLSFLFFFPTFTTFSITPSSFSSRMLSLFSTDHQL